MKALITGASGFIGSHLTKALLNDPGNELVLLDSHLPEGDVAELDRVTVLKGNIQERETRDRFLASNFDVLFHLAAVPGGAAEEDPLLSRKVNLEATLDLIEAAADSVSCPRVVYASTIAVLCTPLPYRVDDSCPLVPAMTYGTHKAMVELALADMHRRGQIDAVSVRLPGIIARPLAPSGLKSAFLSNVFHALKTDESFVSPVSENATMWLMSVEQCVANLLHAANLESRMMPDSRVVTLPAIRCRMADLVETIADAVDRFQVQVEWVPDESLEALFGSQPPLETPAAEKAGFLHDGSLSTLVINALAKVA
jgi:nucleoside-diphosphate-sugar epimerase